ncbi:hypothetical protein F1Z12_03460 [Staphylococcus aureus]|nr:MULTISPECIES: hypothetical protein [Staphylococcus]MBD6670326.1 hypothetical protein [Staphylococcus aureus]MBD6830286.1 hypothetical protein [Staphylococcus aureus]CPD15412.1 Uncharacterised protein [Staphylococcus aureus]SUM50515.1 Uncharacterised protein [Staphylococcus epidermidis]HCV2499346.1 hypothetical protein [Staphylococcus aureus]
MNNNENVQRETYIEWIEMMVGLSDLERERLDNDDIRKVRFKYKMALQEKTDELDIAKRGRKSCLENFYLRTQA